MLAEIMQLDVVRADRPHADPRVPDGREDCYGTEKLHGRRTEVADEIAMAHVRVRQKETEHT